MVLGAVVLGAGIYTMKNQAFLVDLLGSQLYIRSMYVLIATGAIIIAISFLGGCGAVKEIPWMLKAYFLILFTVIIIMLTGGILGFMFRNKVQAKIREKMVSTISDYGKDKLTTIAWEMLQTTFKCCGISPNNTGKGGYVIWKNSTLLQENNITVPQSCCKEKEKAMECQEDPDNFTHEKDCYSELKAFVMKNAMIPAGIGIGISCALIICMLLTCGVLRKLEKEKKLLER